MDLHQDNRIFHQPLRLHPSLPLKSPTLDTPSFPSTPLDGAMPQPGYPGSLSLRHYRRYLSQDDGFIAFNRNQRKTLRRTNAALNLNQSQTSLTPPLCSFSVSSAASSPPPLSPSYSPSAVSQRSWQEPGRLDEFLFPFPSHFSDINTSEQTIRPHPPHSPRQLLDTFRARLATFPEAQDETFSPKHTKARSDSMLLELRKPTATVEHQGASFEILNPHDSLKFARIVSYIEDVDNSSIADDHRDSYISAGVHNGTSILEQDEPIKHNHISDEEEQKVHYDLVGDLPHQPMPSISQRLEGKEPDRIQSRNWRSTAHIRPVTGQSFESDLGEPGSSILASYDGAWTGTMDDILETKHDDEMQRRKSLKRSTSGRKKKEKTSSFRGFRRLRGFAKRLFR